MVGDRLCASWREIFFTSRTLVDFFLRRRNPKDSLSTTAQLRGRTLKKLYDWCQTLWNPIAVMAVGACAGAAAILFAYSEDFGDGIQAIATILGPALAVIIFYYQRREDKAEARRQELKQIRIAFENALRELENVPDTINSLRLAKQIDNSQHPINPRAICKDISPSLASACHEGRKALGIYHIPQHLAGKVKESALALEKMQSDVDFVANFQLSLMNIGLPLQMVDSGTEEAINSLDKGHKSVIAVLESVIAEINKYN